MKFGIGQSAPRCEDVRLLAVLDALHRAGATPVGTPMTSGKLWRALNAV